MLNVLTDYGIWEKTSFRQKVFFYFSVSLFQPFQLIKAEKEKQKHLINLIKGELRQSKTPRNS